MLRGAILFCVLLEPHLWVYYSEESTLLAAADKNTPKMQ